MTLIGDEHPQDVEVLVKYGDTWIAKAGKKNVKLSNLPHIVDILCTEMAHGLEQVHKNIATGKWEAKGIRKFEGKLNDEDPK